MFEKLKRKLSRLDTFKGSAQWMLYDAQRAMFHVYQGENKLCSMRQCLLCTTPTRFHGFDSATLHKQQSSVDMSLEHIIRIPNQPNTKVIVYDLNQQGPESTIYRTRGKQANDYTPVFSGVLPSLYLDFCVVGRCLFFCLYCCGHYK